jgi:hypothetical protein
MFRTVLPSTNRSWRLYIQHQVYVIQVRGLHASWHLVPASKQSTKPVWHIPGAVCTVLNSWWWTEEPSETCRVIFNKLENCASSWFYYRKKNFIITFEVLRVMSDRNTVWDVRPYRWVDRNVSVETFASDFRVQVMVKQPLCLRAQPPWDWRPNTALRYAVPKNNN